MSKKQNKIAALKTKQKEDAGQVVKMRFSEDKFYNDLSVAHFEKGKIYEIHGADQIQRWVKRGGEIVQGEIEVSKPDVPNPSELIGGIETKEAEPVSEVENHEESRDSESTEKESDSKED